MTMSCHLDQSHAQVIVSHLFFLGVGFCINVVWNCLPPITVEVDHSHIISEGGRQSRPVKGVHYQEFGGDVVLFLQQEHSSTVIGSGGASHNGHSQAAGESVSRVQGESWSVTPILISTCFSTDMFRVYFWWLTKKKTLSIFYKISLAHSLSCDSSAVTHHDL